MFVIETGSNVNILCVISEPAQFICKTGTRHDRLHRLESVDTKGKLTIPLSSFSTITLFYHHCCVFFILFYSLQCYLLSFFIKFYLLFSATLFLIYIAISTNTTSISLSPEVPIQLSYTSNTSKYASIYGDFLFPIHTRLQIFTRVLRSFNLPVGAGLLRVARSGSTYDVNTIVWWIVSMIVCFLVCCPKTQLL